MGRVRCLPVCLLLLGFSASAAELEPGSNARAIVATVRVVHSQRLTDRLSYPAQVRSKINATFVSDIDGVVRKIVVPLGGKVALGQRIVTVENADPALEFKPLAVRAPVTGVVSSLEVTEGTRVTKGQKLGTVTDPSKTRILIEVSGSDLKHFSPGLAGSYTPSHSESTPIPVRVLGLSPSVDPATGTATAELEITSKSGDTHVGDLGQVTFEVNARDSFVVPESAIVYRKRDPYVRLVTDGKVHWAPVKLGSTAGKGDTASDDVEIVSGLQEGQSVVENVTGFVEEGGAVQVRSPASTTSK
jgi:multidrug efflux pump subunit AcrA (membrane-fusion protein)